MASQSTSPKAPQAEVIAVSGTNNPARVNAYTDNALTKRNTAQAEGFVPNDTPAQAGSTTLGNIRSVYAEDRVAEITQDGPYPATDPPPHAPNSWKIADDAQGRPRSRDPYRNGGMHGQPFFDQ